MIHRNLRLALVASTMLFGFAGAANAALIVSAAVGGAPTGVSYVNFDNLLLGGAGGVSGGVTVTITADGGVVTGAADGLYAPPYISGSNGALFGDATVLGPDTTKYLTTGRVPGSVTITFPGLEMYMGLLWGSVDDFNNLDFYNGATLVGSVNGLSVQPLATGDQGVLGTFYANITSTLAFDRVVATSTSYAFEFDNVAYNPTIPNQGVPEPLSLGLLGLLGLGIVGLGLTRGRKGTSLSNRSV